MNNIFTHNLNTANIGFCISENNGIYIANNFIIGFTVTNIQSIILYTFNQQFIIYKHHSEYLDFKSVSKKIITRILDSIRYDINTNIYIDKIIDEVIKDV